MESILLDGKLLSSKVKEHVKNKISERISKRQKVPTLATILVGENPSSHTYVNMKVKACEAVGMKSKLIRLSEDTNTDRLLREIQELNSDEAIDGILLQHPSPHQINERLAFDTIQFEKDVDGVTIQSFGKLSMNEPTFYPCTPFGIMLLMSYYNIPLEGKHAVVVGRSPILGKPMSMLLLDSNCTVTMTHSRTKNLPDLIRQADIVVGAVGKPEFIQADWLKKGVVLIDAGYNAGNVGDVDIKNGKLISSYYTPVPGGVGPMTIAVLLWQTLLSVEKKFLTINSIKEIQSV